MRCKTAGWDRESYDLCESFSSISYTRMSQFYHYRIVPGESLARLWMTGRVDRDNKLAALEGLRSDPDWHENMDVIWDCSRTTEVIILPEDVPPLLEAVLEDAGGMDVFYGERDNVFVIAKLFATLERRRGKDARVCTTMDEVLDVLGRIQLPPALRDPDDGDQQRCTTA